MVLLTFQPNLKSANEDGNKISLDKGGEGPVVLMINCTKTSDRVDRDLKITVCRHNPKVCMPQKDSL